MSSAGRAKLTSAVKRAARRLVDRALAPHLEQQTTQFAQMLDARLGPPTEPPGAPAPAAHPLLADFNHLLHELRTIELRDVPATGKVLLSAGCAGAWYFDWLERSAGPFERHVGVELYSPRPDGLAADVTWISESASRMPAVADTSVDVVFSGQNIEHLWIDDVVGFLLEARRVLRPDGWLVVDSPNRLATEALGWVHPEHTVEFTAAEAQELFELAGFRVATTRGIVHRAGPLPLFAGTFRVAATHPGLTVRVLRSDGSVLASATGTVTEHLPVTEFGATVELVAEQELAEPLIDVAVIVEMEPDPRSAADDT